MNTLREWFLNWWTFFCYVFGPVTWEWNGWKTWPRAVWCRFRGHPYRVRWFSRRDEPDMRCENCGEDLG